MSGRAWPPEEMARLRATVAGCVMTMADWRKLAAEFPGRTANALRLKWEEMQGTPAVDPPPTRPHLTAPTDPVADAQAERERREVIRRERADLEAAAGERSFRATLERLVTATAQTFAPITPKALIFHPLSDTVEETLLLNLSDWHAFETVDVERVRGFNAYSGEVMARRARAIVERATSIKARMERGGGWRFPRLIIGCNGDFTSGTVHEVERHSDAPSITHAVYGTGLVLAQAIRDLASEFPDVEVFCSSGNHGRLPDHRRVAQKDPLRSWDTMVYWFAKEHLRLTSHLRWHIPNAYSVAFDVEGWRFLQTHGHDVKSWNSIPHYGINRLIGNVNALEASRLTPIHYFLFAHFHTKASLEHAAGESFINGSLIGGTEFSVQGMGKSDAPSQLLLGVHPEHGVTHRWPLRAEGGTETYDFQPWRNE